MDYEDLCFVYSASVNVILCVFIQVFVYFILVTNCRCMYAKSVSYASDEEFFFDVHFDFCY